MPRDAVKDMHSFPWADLGKDAIEGITRIGHLLGISKTSKTLLSMQGMQLLPSTKSQSEKNMDLLKMNFSEEGWLAMNPLEGLVLFWTSKWVMDLPMTVSKEVKPGNYQWFLRDKRPSLFVSARQEFFIYWNILDGDTDFLQCFQICGCSSASQTFQTSQVFRSGPKEKILAGTGGWLPDEVGFKIYVNKCAMQCVKVVYVTFEGMDYPVMLEFRWSMPGQNPRKLHLLYTPEVPQAVQTSVQAQVYHKDRWDPEARQDALHGKGPGGRGPPEEFLNPWKE